MTQKNSLINLLSDNEWVCSTKFQENYIPEFRSLIAHMRKHEGYQIISEPCLSRCGKQHNSKGLKRWKLMGTPVMGYTPPKIIRSDNCARDYKCYHFRTFKYCNCITVEVVEKQIANKLF